MSLPIHRRALFGALTMLFVAGCGGGRNPFDSGSTSMSRLAEASLPAHPLRDPGPGQAGNAPPPELGESSTLHDYLRYAALNNPGLEASFQRFMAAVERLPQVRALPDPRLTYGHYLREVETRVGPMQQSLALAQTFPWFGTLRDRGDAAGRAANAEHRRFEGERLELFYRVESAYNELHYLNRSIEITRVNVELLQQFERVARARYRVGTTGHPDIIRLQVELGRLEDRLRQLRDLRAPHTAKLNAALSRPADAAIAATTSVDDRSTDRTAAELMAALREHNPLLAALAEDVERERINARLAEKDGLPDFTVGLAWTEIDRRDGVSVRDNGSDAVLATLSLTLPIWRDKYDAGVREAVARRLALSNKRLDATNRLEADLVLAVFDHHDARRRVELYRDTLIPKASESLQASLSAFQQSAADFLDLLDTERTLLEFQLGLERAQVDRATSRAALERSVGITLSELEAAAGRETTP